MTDLRIAEKKFSTEQVQALIDAGLAFGQKNTPASTTLSTNLLHGPSQSGTGYGPLAAPGVRPQMLSAMTRPYSLAQVLDIVPSEVNTEKLDIHTGVTTETGTNATGWCGDPPPVGAFKKCGIDFEWGKYYIKDDLVAVAEVGMRLDHADVPRAIMNAASPVNAGNRFIPDMVFTLSDTMSALRYQAYLVGVSAERDVCHVTIQGDTTLTSANAHHGWIAEPSGLDTLIATGYADRLSSTTCPVVDPIVKSFNALVTGTDANSRILRDVMTGVMYSLNQRARRAGMMGVQWAFVMREELFYNLVQHLACKMFTTFCTATLETSLSTSAETIERLRLDMLTGGYIWLDGRQYPVITDECVPQDTLGNQYYKSDMYVIPVSWQGMPLTYFQYFNQENQYSMEYSGKLGKQLERMNGGLWLVGERDTGMCFEHHYQMLLRLILEAPFLSARVDDVWYYFREDLHNAVPGDSSYFDGGDSYIQPQFLTS